MGNKAFYYEAGRDYTAMVALTDDGTHKKFNSAARQWSDYDGYSPIVRPDGVISGGVITPAVSGTNDMIDYSQLNCYLAGVDKTGSAAVAAGTDKAITREVTNGYLIGSVCLKADYSVYVLEGTAHVSAHSATRAAAGGPPLIPVGEIELAQIHLTSTTAAPITADQIKQVPGVSQEMAYLPNFEIKYADVSARVIGYSGVKFVTAKPLIHTGVIAARVYAQYYSPSFALLQDVRNFDFARVTGSLSSETFYDRVKGFNSESLGGGAFEFAPDDPVGDPFLGHIGKKVWMKFKPDDLKTPYIIQQGYVYESGSFPADGLTVFSMTIVAGDKGERIIA